jgi:hypothetical protein
MTSFAIHRAVLSLVLFVFSATGALAQGPIRVFVTSADAGSGFTSNGTGDSVLDLSQSLNGKRRLMLVTSPAEADLVVEVETRDSHWESSGVYSYKDKRGRSQYYSGVRKERVVYATIVVDDYRHQVHGEGGTWRAASSNVAGQIDKWVGQNVARLMERRNERPQ